MNLFELQQRANKLVQKVNEYEASLTGTTIDEEDTLNQHTYADLYCLRPVMKLLFGATLAEKLNRTLDNDLPLRVFASSAPAWNSTFNLLSYNPGLVQSSFIDYDTNNYSSNHPKVSMDNTKNNSVKYHLDLWLPRINDNNETDIISLKINNTTIRLGVYNLKGLYLTCKTMFNNKYLWNTYDFKLLNMNNRETYYGGRVSFDLDFRYLNTNDYPIVTISNRISSNYSTPEGVNMGQQINLYYNVEALYLHKSVVQDISGCYSEVKTSSMDVGYKSDTHEFMGNIDMYNNYNMCQLDVTQNSVTNKETRIPLGINYSYSANIADALVTECQVANIFNWNTTTSTQIANNTISINRQVPGIVCYYLGNGYNSTFTATIPYSPRLDNINSINYGTPPYYGAFYRNGNDIETSQVGLQMGAEACRIFMPGLNYTRGKLESPQQIWQPEKLVGDANIDKGFNWQGRAIYHELVFKNRRAGSSDAGVDFKPTLDSIADNDPQGLATRFALAQQKPYYYNRPWFKELDELYGADPTKLVNYINNNSVVVPKDEEVYQLETGCNLVGSPDYNELTGRLTNCSSSNYCEVTSPIKLDIQNADSLEPKTCKLQMDLFFTPGNYSSIVDLFKFAALNNNNNAIQYNPSSGHWSFYGANSSNSFTGLMNPGQTYAISIVMYRLNSSRYRVMCGLNELNEDLSPKRVVGSMASEYPLPLSAETSFTNKFFLNNSDTEYLLDKSYLLYRYNTTTDTILNFTKFVIKDNTVFDKSLFTLTGAVNLSDDGILSPITPTTGAVITNNNNKLNIDTNKNFEVYSPRIYTSSNNGTPFKLEANNNGYIEAKVAFEADKVAASVSCQLLNFLVFDLSVYITQADINWVQFKFVNDVTNKTFKAYAMSDKTNDNWQLINEGAVTTDENPAVYIINNYKLGFMDSDTDNKKLDLTSIKLILEGETLFSSMSTPGAQPMNDTEFYNQYKLDYDTWANALNKPL